MKTVEVTTRAAQPTNPTTRYPAAGLDAALDDFRRAYPEFEQTAHLDRLRAREYARLDRQQHVYLDYTGGGLYAESQLRAHMDLLSNHLLGNPHSSNPTSLAATQLVESARSYVLEYFNASPDEYLVIFTANASGALKLVGESYPFAPGGRYLLTFDNHNSVNGIREFAHAKGAEVIYSPMVPPDLRIDEAALRSNLAQIDRRAQNLFAFPAQSNFSGVQHSLEWIAEAKALGWDVFLDAAAFTPTNRLDLGRYKPDFVSQSFYKIFGYPTGIGALIVRKEALAKLQRPWYAGGTITLASVQADGYYLAEGVAAFEDGTVNYLGIPAVEIGLRHIAAIGVETIHQRVRCLTGWLLEQLAGLRHSNGGRVIVLYGPPHNQQRGGTIAFNFVDPAGKILDHRSVESCANGINTSLRTGCFCNPGGFENALGLTAEQLKEYFHREERMTLAQFIVALSEKQVDGVGAVRISLGIVSTFADIYRFMQFAETFVDLPAHEAAKKLV